MEGFEHYMFGTPFVSYSLTLRAIYSRIFKSLFGTNIPNSCGNGGIRTLDRVAPMVVFETTAFSLSATFPNARQYTTD
jgi:hypothetical protein